MIDEKIFEQGKITYNNYQIVLEKNLEEQWENLLEDLIQVEYENGYLIDIGWYPECDPKGNLKILLIKDTDWEHPVIEYRASSTFDIYKAVSVMKAFIFGKAILEIEKKSGHWQEKENNLPDFAHAGVWVMMGIDSQTNETICLEVGETSNIQEEVESDYKAIVKYGAEKSSGEKKFRNALTWSETIFGNAGETRYKAKYRQISQKCREITVLEILEDDNIENRYIVEVQQAWNSQAIYWYPAPTNRKRCSISQWAEIKKLKAQTNNS